MEPIEEQQAGDPRLDALEGKVEQIAAAVSAQGEATMDSMRQLTQSVADGIAAMDEKINLTIAQAQAAPAPQPGSASPPAQFVESLPEGTVRFFSPIKNLRIVIERGGTVLVDGRGISLPFSKIDFNGGVFTTDDQSVIDYLRAVKDPDTGQHLLGQDYFEDPTAISESRFEEMQGPKVVTGPRGSAVARPERPADLAVRSN